ncbi:sugar transferase [Clostridium vitabionis]|uniref:sugar transferase n=1 Tax=Clostridium vitabionis TaxID=2784388 RepID=UPI00188DA73F|nr:sugar transferase [Clostridium vitabionis]
MNHFEKYKRLIKIGFAAVLVFTMSAVYGYIWINYYNKIIWAPFWRRGNWMMIFIYTVLLIFFNYIYGGFKIGVLERGNLIYSQIISLIATDFVTYFQITVQDKRFTTPIPLLVNFGISVFLTCLLTYLFSRIYRRIFPPRKMLLVCGDHYDYHLMEKMNSREDKYQIIAREHYRNVWDKMSEIAPQYDAVIVGDIPSHERNRMIKDCFALGVRTYSVPKISDILLRSSTDFNLFDSPLLLSRNNGLQVEEEFVKRLMDIILSLIGLILTSPIFLIAGLCIHLTDHGPVFYRQKRLTKDGKVFDILKFRTMVVDAEKIGGPQLSTENDPRILPVGRVLRSVRLDELPQLINILRGEMSLVGPRPERPEIAAEIEKQIPEFRYRLKVKAGLTGYAQVYGKYSTSFYDKLKLDLTYIRNYSMLLDLKLIVLTPKIMFIKEASEGISEDSPMYTEEKVRGERTCKDDLPEETRGQNT